MLKAPSCGCESMYSYLFFFTRIIAQQRKQRTAMTAKCKSGTSMAHSESSAPKNPAQPPPISNPTKPKTLKKSPFSHAIKEK
jgi:hypothetical protein